MVENMCVDVNGKFPQVSSISTPQNSLRGLLAPTMRKKKHDNHESEELLRSAFEELEKERFRRIELESELKALKDAQTAPPSPSAKKSVRKSRRRSSKSSNLEAHAAAAEAQEISTSPPSTSYVALQHELKGYRQIVDAMTKEKPAIAAAVEANNARRSAIRTGRSLPQQSPTLPLHVIRLLEVCPFDAKAQEHAFANEECFEWQIYNVKQQKWISELKHFPSFFKALPTLQSSKNFVQENQPLESLRQPGRDRSMLMFLAGCASMGTSSVLTAPSDNSVLTNECLSHIINLANGFPLPQDGGTWQWVGSWRIEKRVIVFARDDCLNSRPQTLDCDNDGWSYAMDASDFLKENPEDFCHECPGAVEDKLTLEKVSFLSGNKLVRHMVPARKVRRRKWTRRRVLIDYPYASEQSRNFLRLLAQNASLTVAANKISDQLVETKMKLTDTQLRTQQSEEETKVKVAHLKQEIKVKEEAIQKLKNQKAEKKYGSHQSKQRPPTTTPVEQLEERKSKAEEREEIYQHEKPQEHKESHSLLSQLMGASSRQLEVIPNTEAAETLNSQNPASDASSDGSCATKKQEDDDDSLEHSSCDERMNGESTSRRNSVASSTSSQKSFDWKRIGRDTIEKFKQGQANAPLINVWLSPQPKDFQRGTSEYAQPTATDCLSKEGTVSLADECKLESDMFESESVGHSATE